MEDYLGYLNSIKGMHHPDAEAGQSHNKKHYNSSRDKKKRKDYKDYDDPEASKGRKLISYDDL
jgi:hypothetical protein